MNTRAQSRLDRSTAEVDALGQEIDAWLAFRRKKDVNRQYQTHLDTLEALVRGGLTEVSEQLAAIDATSNLGSVYEKCDGAERGLLWVRRVHGYFREKFDQRDDPDLAPTLLAADEIVWSCWAEPFVQAGLSPAGAPTPSPAPLAYIDDVSAPQAFLRGTRPEEFRAPAGVPAMLRQEIDAFLRGLPIPVVALPSTTPRAPWWLALLPHEVGHHLQTDLAPGGSMTSAFAAWVPETASEDWRYWSGELFADAMGACWIGAAAAWVTSEVVLTHDEGMRESAPSYPPPSTRLRFSEALCAALGDPIPATVSYSNRQNSAVPLAVEADRLAAAVSGWRCNGLEPLGRLADWNTTRFRKEVRYWQGALRGNRPAVASRQRRAARTVVAALALCCAEEMVAGRSGDAVTTLADSALPLIAESREDGTRAAGAPADHAAHAGAFRTFIRRAMVAPRGPDE